MQLVSFRIWTRVTVSISNDDNHYTMNETDCILDETDCISHSTNILGKGMNPIILPPAMGK